MLSQTRKFLAKPRNKILAGAVFVGIATLAFFSKSLFIAATVNGKPILRFTIIADLERKSGKSALETEIAKSLIFQEAAKQNIVITQDEINSQIESIKSSLASQDQELDKLLAAEGVTKNEFIEEIKIQKIIEKALAGSTTIGDEEVQAYLDKNKDALPKDLDKTKLRESVRQQLLRSKLEQNYQTWIASLKNAAKIKYFINY